MDSREFILFYDFLFSNSLVSSKEDCERIRISKYKALLIQIKYSRPTPELKRVGLILWQMLFEAETGTQKPPESAALREKVMAALELPEK